jgi:hypothetical protein
MWTLANVITIVRICFTPVIALLPFIEGYWPKLIAFVIFVAAAVSDIYDGHLVILWFAFRDARKPMGWEHSAWADYWNQFHGGFVAVTLAVATLLTVYSFFLYLYRNRALFSDRAR